MTWLAAGLGALTLFLLLVKLVTQRRLLSRERRHLEALESLDRLKDEFVASVSHELRTPLTSIRGYLELLLEGEGGELTPQQREFLGVIDRNSDRLLHLVGDLLDVAQIEAGRLALQATNQDLTAFVAESVEAARPVAADRGIELTLHRNGEAHVHGDRTRLAQMMDNLLSNALKFTDAGGQVDVRLLTSNRTAVVEVSDTGMGISTDELDKLFHRFARTDIAGERGIPGSGLGLWISKAIVEAHLSARAFRRFSAAADLARSLRVDLGLRGARADRIPVFRDLRALRAAHRARGHPRDPVRLLHRTTVAHVRDRISDRLRPPRNPALRRGARAGGVQLPPSRAGRDVSRLLAFTVVENVGYRQLTDFWRMLGFVDLAPACLGRAAPARVGYAAGES
jgi:hypothetical protein